MNDRFLDLDQCIESAISYLRWNQSRLTDEEITKIKSRIAADLDLLNEIRNEGSV